MFLSFCTFFVVLTVGFCNAENEGSDCHKVPHTENKDFAKLGGKWYTQQTSPEEATKKCMTYTVTADDQKKNVMIVNKSWENNTQTYKLAQVKNSNEFTLDLAGKKIKKWLLGADSNSYSTWYICLPEETNKGFLLIVTRNKTPSNEVIHKAQDTFKKAGFDLSKFSLKTMEQANCKN